MVRGKLPNDDGRTERPRRVEASAGIEDGDELAREEGETNHERGHVSGAVRSGGEEKALG